MAATAHRPLPPSSISSSLAATGRHALKIDGAGDDQFPVGLRVLVVDDDPICLLILDRLLRQCRYEVTTCGKATIALKMLRENRNKFDLVISDVVMPDMDGFKLLELVGLEMDLPVIMMSANGETSAVMKGITHGACDYLLKPVRIEELRNIWQHVVRKKKRDLELSPGCHEEKHKRESQDGDHILSMNDCLEGASRMSKKRKDIKEEADDVEHDNEDALSTRKPRVVWSVELHQQFVAAVNQLGIDKAVPKRILELMNVPNLTRENIASHLQKYRLYLKRISGVAQQHGGLSFSFPGGSDPSFCAGSRGGLDDLHSFDATDHLVPHSLMLPSQMGFLAQLDSSSNVGMASADPSLLLKLATMQGCSNNQLGRLCYERSLSGVSQADFHCAFSSGLDLNPLAQEGLPLAVLGQPGEPVENGRIGISALEAPTVAGGLNCVKKMAGINSSSSFHASNNTLMMQMLQRQQQLGAQPTNAEVLSLPSVEILGHHMLSSNDVANTKFAVPPSTIICPSYKSESGLNVLGAGDASTVSGSLLSGVSSYSSSTLNMFGRTQDADSTALHSNEEAKHAALSLPFGFGREVDPKGIKVLGSTLVGISETPSTRSMCPDLSSLLELKNGNNRWQRSDMGQYMGQTVTPIINSQYAQTVPCGQGINIGQQDDGQRQGTQPLDENMIVSAVDSCLLKPSTRKFPPQSEHLIARNELKLKDTGLELLVQSKEEIGFLSEPLSSSDELLNLIFKQVHTAI